MAEQIERVTTGYSRHLRARLRAARERRDMSLQQVADAIVDLVNDRRLQHPEEESPDLEGLTGAAVSKWELFKSHPRIDVMALWARAVGLRLVVELDDARGDRIPVLLHAPVADMARALDLSSPEQREVVRSLLRSWGKL